MSAKEDLTQEENTDENPSQHEKEQRLLKTKCSSEKLKMDESMELVLSGVKDLSIISQEPQPTSPGQKDKDTLVQQLSISGLSDSSLEQLQSPSCLTDPSSPRQIPSPGQALMTQLPSGSKPTDVVINIEADNPQASNLEETEAKESSSSISGQSDSCLEQLQSPSCPTDLSSPRQIPSGQALMTQIPSGSKPTEVVINIEADTPQAINLEETEAKESSSSDKANEEDDFIEDFLKTEPLLGIGETRIYFTDFFDRVCKKIILKYGDKIKEEFSKISNDYDRIRYVIQFEEIKNLKISVFNSKSEVLASALEDRFNHCCTDSASERHLHGFKLINRSIQITPGKNRDSLAVRLMKRAWINLLMKKFDEAKEDAHRSLKYRNDRIIMWNSYEILGYCYAKKADCPLSASYFKTALDGLIKSDLDDETKAVTATRISRILKRVKRKKNIEPTVKICEKLKTPRISYGINSTLKCATEAVEVKIDEETGRGIYAKKEIEPGDVIIVEKPFVSALHREHLETHCNYCYKRIRSSFPCDTCSRIWFCSEECLIKSKEGFHSSECYVISLLYDKKIGIMGILAFRILLELTWPNVKRLREKGKIDTKLEDSHPLHTEMNWNEEYRTDDYLTIYKLVTNSKERVYKDLFTRSIIAVYIKQCLKEVGFFQNDEISLEDEIFVASLILRNHQSLSCNAFSIKEFGIGKSYIDKFSISEMGRGLYPTSSLINHSCVPNLCRYSIGEDCIVRASKVIREGDQLFINYIPQFDKVERETRRQHLINRYFLDCKCIACEEKWPTYYENKVYMKFVCPENNCNGIVEYDGREKINCSSCGSKEKFGSLMTEVKDRMKDYKKGVELLKAGFIDEAFVAFKSFQMYADSKLVHPSKFLTKCQEISNRCFDLQGNIFSYSETN